MFVYSILSKRSLEGAAHVERMDPGVEGLQETLCTGNALAPSQATSVLEGFCRGFNAVSFGALGFINLYKVLNQGVHQSMESSITPAD